MEGFKTTLGITTTYIGSITILIITKHFQYCHICIIRWNHSTQAVALVFEQAEVHSIARYCKRLYS